MIRCSKLISVFPQKPSERITDGVFLSVSIYTIYTCYITHIYSKDIMAGIASLANLKKTEPTTTYNFTRAANLQPHVVLRGKKAETQTNHNIVKL